MSINSADGAELRLGFQRFLTRTAAESNLDPWQPWRTVRVRPALTGRILLLRESDDPGRAALLTAGFRLLRGVSPFLPLWLGALAVAPLLAWTAWELARAGRPTAGVLFPLLMACSPFLVDVLWLPYSAVGFYVIGLLALVPLATYAMAGGVRTEGLIARSLVAGTVFAVCVLCRGGTLLILPGFVLALGVAVASMKPHAARGGRALGFLAGVALFLAPFIILRQSGHHDVWIALWEGLGDFDRTKGHVWADSAGRQVLRQSGIELSERYPIFENTAVAEPIFRRLFFADILSDPGWYAGILARRAGATVTQAKLAPWGRRDGISFAPRASPGEGAIDMYYAMTTTADWLGLGPWRFELPLPLLWGPTLVLALAWFAGGRASALRLSRARLRLPLVVLVVTASGALCFPVLFTTAGGFETQAFVVVYFLGLAFLVDEALRYASSRAAGPPAG